MHPDRRSAVYEHSFSQLCRLLGQHSALEYKRALVRYLQCESADAAERSKNALHRLLARHGVEVVKLHNAAMHHVLDPPVSDAEERAASGIGAGFFGAAAAAAAPASATPSGIGISALRPMPSYELYGSASGTNSFSNCDADGAGSLPLSGNGGRTWSSQAPERSFSDAMRVPQQAGPTDDDAPFYGPKRVPLRRERSDLASTNSGWIPSRSVGHVTSMPVGVFVSSLLLSRGGDDLYGGGGDDALRCEAARAVTAASAEERESVLDAQAPGAALMAKIETEVLDAAKACVRYAILRR